MASGSCCSLLLVFAGFCWLLVTCVDFRRLLLAFVAFCFCGCSLSLLCLCDAGRKKGRREGRKEGREGKKAARKEGRKESPMSGTKGYLETSPVACDGSLGRNARFGGVLCHFWGLARRNNYHFGDTSLREGAHNRTRKKITKKTKKILLNKRGRDGLHPSSDGLHPTSDGLHPSSDGLHATRCIYTLLAMASTLVAMASTLVAMASTPIRWPTPY